jgi:hypothetical protein
MDNPNKKPTQNLSQNQKPKVPSKNQFSLKIWIGVLVVLLVFSLVLGVAFNTSEGKKFVQNIANQISPTASSEDIQIAPGEISLQPEQSDSVGVLQNSNFILKSQKNLSLKQIQQNLKLEPDNQLQIEQKSPQEFSLKPTQNLNGKIQKFSLKIQDTSSGNQQKNLSWAFSNYQKFGITETFPSNFQTNLPTNSSIQISFNSETFQSLENFWEINPPTKGSFVKYSNNVSFIPEKLNPATLYSVKIKKGLALEGSKQVLEEDFSWQFETAPDTQIVQDSYYFGRDFYEFPEKESPNITLGGNVQEKINLELYKFRDLGQFLEYLKTKQAVPSWSKYQNQPEKYDLKNLAKNLTQEFVVEKNSNQNLVRFPANLEKGFYLVYSPQNQNSSILQISNLSASFSSDGDKILAWINNIDTKNPVAIAQIKDLEGNQMAVTDDKGLAFFDQSKPQNPISSYQFYQVIFDNDSLVVPVQIFDQNKNEQLEDQDYWNYLYLDKDLYLPSDKLSFWGVLKSKKGEQNTGLKASIYKLENQNKTLTQIQSQDLKISTFDTFLSVFNLQNLTEGNYRLAIQNTSDQTLSSKDFRIQKPIFKNYQINLKTSKNFYLKNDQIEIQGKLTLPDQNPAAGVELSYSGDAAGKVVTDNFGGFTIKYPVTQIQQNGYQPISYSNLEIRLANPEESSLFETLKIPYFAYQKGIYDQSRIENSKGILDLNLNNIDTSKYTQGIKNINNLKGNPVPNQEIQATMTSYVFDKLESGKTYNPITKQTETQYSYQRRNLQTKNINIKTNDQGAARLEIDLENSTYYQIDLELTDLDNQKIKITRYFSTNFQNLPKTTSDYEFVDQKSQNLTQKNYQVGESVKLAIQKDNQTQVQQPGVSYLIIESQNKIAKYNLQNSPEYEFNLEEKHIPNLNLSGIRFDGKTYSKISPGGYAINFAKEKQSLKIDTFPNKNIYQKGEKVDLEFKVSDLEENAKESKILVIVSPKNLSQKQSFEMPDYENLYKNVNLKNSSEYISHSDFATSKTPLKQIQIGNKNPQIIYFEEIQTDQNGLARTSFSIPDKIDSWDIYSVAISKDLLFGSSLASISTTSEIELETILTLDFLQKDKPKIQIRAVGQNLNPQAEVEYLVQIPEIDYEFSKKALASGTELELPNLEAGQIDLKLTVKTDSKNTSINKKLNIKTSYTQKNLSKLLAPQEILDDSKLSYLEDNQKLEVAIGSSQAVSFYNQLKTISNQDDGTLEGLQKSYLAKKLLNQYYQTNFKIQAPDLQTFSKNSGYSNYPYQESNIEFSGQFLESDIQNLSGQNLKSFFELQKSQPQTNPDNQFWILLGLTLNQQNTLQELKNLNQKTDLSLKQKLILSNSLIYAGDNQTARQNYYQIISENASKDGDFIYVKDDEKMNLTSELLGLATLLGEKEAEGINKYLAQNNHSSFKQILYIQKSLQELKNDDFTIDYQLKETSKLESLKYNQVLKLNLTKKELQSLKLEQNSQDIKVAISYQTEPDLGLNQPEITKTYKVRDQVRNQFKLSEIIEVDLEVKFGSNILDGCYKISHHLPAGLVFLPENTSNYQNLNQVVDFCILPKQNSTTKISYLAKAVSKGTFEDNSTTSQNLQSKPSLSLSKSSQISID